MATALLARPLAAVGGAAGRYPRPRVPLSGRARVVGQRPDTADARRSAGRSPPRDAAAAAAAASTAIALGPAAASSRPPPPPLPSPPPPYTPPPGAETRGLLFPSLPSRPFFLLLLVRLLLPPPARLGGRALGPAAPTSTSRDRLSRVNIYNLTPATPPSRALHKFPFT
ncbi:translation initiation factor IF-2-like [Schistocerca piceifrons]|uniref:translation initiation factor IF-2-like n=1 Tax=Schistocerca piceifrons TaxID=274613 RepID=UPI001F5EC7C3|nr:translation initiation factor IF-2-like [Schistocerca piceifrons]